MISDRTAPQWLPEIGDAYSAKYPEAMMPEAWLEENANGWREYVQGIKERYSPQQVVERLELVDQIRSMRSYRAKHLVAFHGAIIRLGSHGARRTSHSARRRQP